MRHRLDYFPNNDLMAKYRQVFSSAAGNDVICHILFELGVFTEITEGPEDVALKNYGVRLMKILGGGEPHESSMQGFIKRLMKQPLKEKE